MTAPRPAWRRELRRALVWHRRLLAAGLGAGSVALTISALAPAPPETTRVYAAAADLPGGHRLAGDDVRTVELPPGAVPAGALRPGAEVAGRLLAGPVRGGEPLTDARLVGPGLLSGYAGGLVAAPVRVADPAAVRLLRPGDVVDVLAAQPASDGGDGSGPDDAARVVAGAVRVVTVPEPGDDAAAGGDGGLVVLATSPGTAAVLASAAVTARLSITLRGQ